MVPSPASVLRARVASVAGRFQRDASGMGAVEFALIAPVLVLLYLGGTELALAIAIDRKVQTAASTITDIATQIDDPASDGLKKVMALPKSILHPYPSNGIESVLTAVWIDDKGKATVDCSIGVGATADVKGSVYALPPKLALMKSRTVLVGKVKLHYAPVSKMVWSEGWDIRKEAIFNPRNNARYQWKGC